MVKEEWGSLKVLKSQLEIKSIKRQPLDYQIFSNCLNKKITLRRYRAAQGLSV